MRFKAIFRHLSGSGSSSSCDLRAAASSLRVTFVGHFVQSAALPAPSPLAPPVKSLKTSASASVVSFSFLFGGVPRAWILHMFICLYDGGTAQPARRLALKLSDCKSVTHSPSFSLLLFLLNTRKQICIYLLSSSSTPDCGAVLCNLHRNCRITESTQYVCMCPAFSHTRTSLRQSRKRGKGQVWQVSRAFRSCQMLCTARKL